MGHIPLTFAQKVSLIAWHLAHGEGLTDQQIQRLARVRKAGMVLDRIRRVAPIEQDAAGVWAWTGGQLAPSQHLRRLERPRGHDPNEPERAALVAFQFATRGEVISPQLSEQLGITRQGTYRMLCSLSIPLPVYLEDRRTGKWAVLDFKEQA